MTNIEKLEKEISDLRSNFQILQDQVLDKTKLIDLLDKQIEINSSIINVIKTLLQNN